MTIATSTLQLDESSIVANAASGFTSSYIPVNPATEPSYCTLPADLTISFNPLPLTQLNQVCKFVFPQIVAPPPVFIPNIPVPTACTTFNGSVVINTSTSSSQISVTGASSTINDAAPGCGFTSVLQLSLSAPPFCSEFTSSGAVTFVGSDQIQLLGAMSLTPSNVPDCGVILGGQIRLAHPDFCESFSASSNVTFTSSGGASVTGGITVTPVQPPGCGIALGGDINIHVPNTCSQFSFNSNLQIQALPAQGGKPVHVAVTGPDGKNPPNISGSSTGCGGSLTGQVDIGLAASALDATQITICKDRGNWANRTVVLTLGLDDNITPGSSGFSGSKASYLTTEDPANTGLSGLAGVPPGTDVSCNVQDHIVNDITDCWCYDYVYICVLVNSQPFVVQNKIWVDCLTFYKTHQCIHGGIGGNA